MIYLDSPDDMQWLHDVHGVPRDMRCAVLYGNEDAPTHIDAWRKRNPHHQAAPDYSTASVSAAA